ncbi:hypothetical protein K1T71_012442, partial [Dendrolimus kikuchii]
NTSPVTIYTVINSHYPSLHLYAIYIFYNGVTWTRPRSRKDCNPHFSFSNGGRKAHACHRIANRRILE